MQAPRNVHSISGQPQHNLGTAKCFAGCSSAALELVGDEISLSCQVLGSGLGTNLFRGCSTWRVGVISSGTVGSVPRTPHLGCPTFSVPCPRAILSQRSCTQLTCSAPLQEAATAAGFLTLVPWLGGVKGVCVAEGGLGHDEKLLVSSPAVFSAKFSILGSIIR